MLLLPYLYDRQIGSLFKTQSSITRPNLDCLLSRLVCGVKDVFITQGEDGIPVPPFTCKFRKDKESDLLAVANEDGEVCLIDTDNGKGVVKNFTAHNNAVFDLCWLPDKNCLLTGSGDFRCCLFDMATCKKVSTFRFHTASVKVIDVFQDGRGTTFAAGSKDGNISIWDVREDGLHSQPAIVINQAHERTTYNSNKKANTCVQSSSSVSAVTFKDGHTLASAGVGDSVIKIWDLRKTYDSTNMSCRRKPRESITFSDNKVIGFGYTSLVFNSLCTKLYACSTANKIFEIDCHSYTKKYERFTGLKCSTYFVKMSLSHDDQYILSGSSDNKAYIWKTSKPGSPIFELPGHTAEVTSVAWGSYDNTKVATCADDHKVLLWKTKYSDHPDDNPNKDLVAASCPYSSGITNDFYDTISIFLPVTPVNHTKRNPNFKSPPTSQTIRSYFSPLPPTPVLRGEFAKKHSHSPSNENRKSAEPQSSHSPSNRNGGSSSVSSLPQSSHSPNSESTKPQTVQSPNGELSSVWATQSGHSPGDTSRETTKPKSESICDPQSIHTPKRKSTSASNDESSSDADQQSDNSPNCESTQPQSSLSRNNANRASTSVPHSSISPNSNSTQPHSSHGLSTPIVRREPLSPRKNIQGSSLVKGSGGVSGKENGSSVKKSNGQTKRKLDVTDRVCKYHLDGCGKTRGKTRCGKRIVSYVVPEKNNLTDYFSIIQTPDKHQNSAT